jgi:2-polyprenyl-3-methyl-5-hydroxy-6-metoxy-1,4-benzoquinol methylase
MRYDQQIESPLGGTAKLLETRSAAHISALYTRAFSYTPDFGGIDEIAVYECDVTGYRFFYPYALEGKADLYRELEKYDWCYEENKWEHNIVASRISRNASVLDVGCGRGAFLSKVSSPNRTGIELNKSAADVARKRGIAIVEELIGDHSGVYDVVTAFQVLEHIADPLTFLSDCLAAVKPGGLLIIAVPNNDSFIRFADLPLNQPPHHVGMWTPSSIAALEKLLPMAVQMIEEEPIRELGWYQQVMEQRYLPKRWQRSLYYRLHGNRIVERFIAENASSISGHTVLATFRKLGV